MALLNDQTLDSLIGARVPLASGIRHGDKGRWNSRIQPASIDLSIGKIYVPGAMGDEAGSTGKPLRKLLLNQGQTAVVETAEELSVPPDIAGVGFPPSSVSMQGLLMTNPGHVDPGFKGSMRFTVINIAKEPYDLRAGALICTLLFFRMETAPSIHYGSLDQAGRPPTPDLETGLLRVLSHDFMDIDERAETKARDVVEKIDLKARYRQIGIPVLTALIAATVTLGLAVFNPMASVKERIVRLEEKSKLSVWDDSIVKLGGRIRGIEKHLGIEPE